MHTHLDPARSAHAGGQYATAERLALAFLNQQPGHPEGLTVLAAARLAQEQAEDAIELFREVVRSQPSDPSAWSNLAEGLRAAGRHAEAEQACRTAISLRPEYPEAFHNLGAVLLKLGRYAEAEESFRTAVRLRPSLAAAHAGCGDACLRQGRWRDAVRDYRAALNVSPDLATAHANLGLLLAQSGDLEEGLAHCRRAVQLRPRDRLAVSNLGRVLADAGRFEQAMEALEEAVRLDPDSADLALASARVWLELGDYEQAVGWADRAARLDPRSEDARGLVGAVAAECGEPEAAEQIYRDILSRDPARPEALVGLARALLDQGDVDGADAAHRLAIAAEPDSPVTHSAYGHTLATAGRLEDAVGRFRAALSLNRRFIPALSGVLTTLRGKGTEEDIQLAEELLGGPRLTDSRRAALHFGVGQALDGRGDYPAAAEHFAAANAAQAKHRSDRGRGYNPADYDLYASRLIRAFSPEYFRRVRGWGDPSRRPIFIVGMPRSGTTLTEQILASHPRVHGAGERRFLNRGFLRLPALVGTDRPPTEALEELTPASVAQAAAWHLSQLQQVNADRERVVDKMPENFQLLGWIATLFPNAAVIHCVRDVRDVGLSCWVTNFAAITWANDLRHIAQRVRWYRRLRDHYARTLPLPVFPVEYEQLVADQEGTTRRLLEFVGLDWDPACLQFHQTERLVRTASVSQVRQPIYARSVERWRRYEKTLAPLIEEFE